MIWFWAECEEYHNRALGPQEAYLKLCSMKSLYTVYKSTTVCHTPVACSQCHPLTQLPSHMYGLVTERGPTSSRLTERLLSLCTVFRLQHWTGGCGGQWSDSSLCTTETVYLVYLDMHADRDCKCTWPSSAFALSADLRIKLCHISHIINSNIQ